MNNNWNDGLSRTSIGRFGVYRDNYFIAEQGFLCWNADYDTISVESNKGKIILGKFKLSRPSLFERTADWTTVKYQLKYEENKTLKTGAVVYQSLLSPAIVYDVKDNIFFWQFDREYQKMRCCYPLREGYKIVSSNWNYSVEKSGKLLKPWLLFFDNSMGIEESPFIFVFQKQPERIECLNNDFKKFVFKGNAGRIFIMPVFGIDTISKEDLQGWRKKIPSKIIEKINFWVKILMAYPVLCKEEYRIDRKKKVVEIRNKFKYLITENDWNIKPVFIAPVPPVLGEAGEYGYPVKFRQKIVNSDYPVRTGYYRFAYSKQIEYELPITKYSDFTILPVRVINDVRYEKINEELKNYLMKPEFTFGGDDTYDPENIQDVLHNWRVLGWALWCLGDKDRRIAAKRLSSGLRNFKISNYDKEYEKLTGNSFLKERKIWDIVGDVTYDYEWYNGMQLAGLWSYVFYSGEKKAIDLVKKKWNIVEGLLDYYRIFNDWETGTFWTDTAGVHLWMDGFNYGWQGLLCAIRLAKILKKNKTLDELEYITAKSTMTRWCMWHLQKYAVKHRNCLADKENLNREDILKNYIAGGFIAKKGITLSKFYDQGNTLSYFVPELILLYRDNPDIVEKIKYGQYVQLPRDIPDWKKRIKQPYKNLREKDVQHEALDSKKFYKQLIAWNHFYFIDPLLITRALLLKEDFNKIKEYSTRLTGPVIASYIVGTHPTVVFPVYKDFRGNIWDEKKKILILNGKSIKTAKYNSWIDYNND